MLGSLLGALRLTESSCRVCGREFEPKAQGYICGLCFEGMRPSHPLTYERLDYVSSYKVFGLYDGVLAEAIKLIKFRSVKPLALEVGKRIREDLVSYMGEVEPDVLTFVPLHSFRLWNRGFNHNVEILKGASVEFEDILLRVRYSRPLAVYGREKRAEVVRDAFSVRKGWVDGVEGKKVLVFNDVLTTGATSRSVAELLLSLGASEVFFYFLSKEK